MTADRFETLLAGLLDGSLIPAEQEELLAAAAGHPAHGRRLVELLCFEPLLADHALGEEGGDGFVRRVQQNLQAEPKVEHFTQGILTRLRQRAALLPEMGGPGGSGSPRGRRPLHLAAVAVLILVGLGVFVAWPPRSQVVASAPRLEAVQGEVYVVAHERATPAASGQELLAGQGLQTVGEDSSVTVRFPDATRLELSLNTLVRLERADASRKVFLAEGLVTAEVPQRPAGQAMVLATTEAEVTLPTAAKTRFRLSGTPGSLHIELASGAVAVTRHSDGQSLRLKTGEYALITPRAGPLVARPLPPRLSPPAALLGGHTDRVASLTFSPDGQTLVSGAADGTVRFWDIAAQQQRDLLAVVGRVSSVFFSPDGQTLAAVVALLDAAADARVELRDLPGLRRLAAFPAIPHALELRTTAFSPDGRSLVSVDAQRNIHRWDVATQELENTFRTRKGRVLCLAFSLDGQELTAVDEYGQVTTWRLDTGRVHAAFRLENYQGDRVCAAFSPDRRRFVTGTRSGTVQVWEAAGGKLLATLHGHRSAVYCLAFSADGALLATGSRDGTARLWDVASAQELATLEGGRAYVRSVAFSPDGKTLASGSNDGTVKLWSMVPRHGLNEVREGQTQTGGRATGYAAAQPGGSP